MKFLLLFAVLAIAYLLWRNARIGRRAPPPATGQGAAPGTGAMVQCPICAVHLPRTDAVSGGSGQLYCCEEHRQRGG